MLLGQGVLTRYGEPLNRPAFDSARVSPYSRWHAARSNVVTNALHGLVQLTPEQAQLVKSNAAPNAQQLGEWMTLGLLI